MRLVGAASAAIALALVGSAQAQPPGTAPLASDELLFEIRAVGTARSRADHVVVTLNYMAPGPTAPEARAAAVALCNRLRAIARGFGAEQVPIGLDPLSAGALADQVSTFGTPDEGAGSTEDRGRPPFTGTGMMRLRLRDATRFAELRTALEQAGAINIVGPVYQLVDDSAARREARLDALAKARADAEQFAGTQNMRVVRMVRFSEATDAQAEMMRMMMNQFGGRASGSPSQVETSVNVTVSFSLAPR